jgi:hypothetical protein
MTLFVFQFPRPGFISRAGVTPPLFSEPAGTAISAGGSRVLRRVIRKGGVGSTSFLALETLGYSALNEYPGSKHIQQANKGD